MDDEPVEFYSQQRWDNWLERIEEADLSDDEAATRLFLNLQTDTAIAVAKVLEALEEGSIDAERAGEELATIQAIVYEAPDLETETALELVDAVQTSLVGVFTAADRHLAGESAPGSSIEELLEEAVEAEDEEAYEAALEHVSAVGLHVIEGESLPVEPTQALEFGLVTEWLGGLDSLGEALAGPKVVED
ncbi:MAG: DUF2150 family protein [Halobacteriales archaeon]